MVQNGLKEEKKNNKKKRIERKKRGRGGRGEVEGAIVKGMTYGWFEGRGG